MIRTVNGELRESRWSTAEAEQLRGRMREEGYLLLRGLLPREQVAAVRDSVLEACAQEGWLRNADASQDVVRPEAACEPPDPRYYAAYRRVVSLEEYEALAHTPALMEAAEALLDDDRILPRPAKLARLIFPQKAEVGATPPHQDFPHEQGAQEAYTAWVPLGDVPRELGGVAVWPGSHRQGVLEHGFVPGVGGLGVPESDAPAPTWLAADFRMGDVLMFHSLTVHGALPNRSGDRLRISADFRYQRAVDPVTPHMLKPSGGELDWEQIYADWHSEEFQYYWRKWGLRTVPYDRSYYRKRDEEALTRAAAGDEHARDFLTTIEARNPDPAARLRARQVLAGARPEAGR